MSDQSEILEAILQAAAGEFAIIHFERRSGTFRVWPPDNGAPFSVAVVQADEVEWLRSIAKRQRDRCPSCDHLREFHSEPGCWFAVTQGTPGEALNCRCSVVAWPRKDDVSAAADREHDD